MIKIALQMLVGQAERSTEELTKIREQIKESFEKDYVITPSTMEALLKAQKSVYHWAKVQRIVAQHSTEEEQVGALEKWVASTTEQLTECGRSRSTSLVASAEYEAEEDTLKLVLRDVRGFVSYARSQG
jgi:hypothetical protein